MNIIKALLIVASTGSIGISQDINISGTVSDTGGIAITGAVVMLEKHGYEDTTETDGSFSLIGVVDINDQIGQPFPHTLATTIKNGLLYINIEEKSRVDITIYTLQGRVIS